MRKIDGTRVSHHTARRARARFFVTLNALALVAFGGLGWLTAPRRGDPPAAAEVATPAPILAAIQDRWRSRVPRVTRLRALDTVVEVDKLQLMNAPEVSGFAAKKWTEMLGMLAETAKKGFGQAMAFDEYFMGWLAVTWETSPYTAAQFGNSLHAELCKRPQQERELLLKAAPAFAAAATDPCPMN